MPGTIFLPAQIGQFLPWLRLATVASYRCPLGQIHHTFSSDPLVISSGRKAFVEVSHSAASCGWVSASDPIFATWFLRLEVVLFSTEQIGQPFSNTRLDTVASYSCPLEQTHHTFLREPLVTCSGVNSPFFVGCHSLDSRGWVVAKSL